MHSVQTLIWRFLPFWLYLAVCKFGAGLHYTLMAPYGEQFMPIWVVGFVIGGASLLQLIFDVPVGYLLDRFGYVRMLAIGTVGFFLSAVCFVVGLSEITFILSVLLATFGWLFYGPGGSAYILSHSTDSESGRYFSLREIFASIGIVSGAVVLPLVLLYSPVAAGTLMCVLFGISLLLFLVPTEKPAIASPSRSRASLSNGLLDMRRLNPASGVLALLTFAGAVFYGIIWFVIPLVIVEQQAGSGLLGLGLGVFDFSVIVLGYLLGTLADKANKRTLVFFGLLIFSVFGVLVGLDFGWLFILFGFFATVGEEMAQISLWSWMHHLDTDHTKDGRVSAVITLFEDLGWAVGPALAGIFYTVFGPALTISIGALPIFIVWIIYYLFVQKHFPYEIVYAVIPHRPKPRRHKH